ncbi:hypothetical protein [Pontiella agarivorans]|uniref:Uncharacterized protein n=1 Tax=Pontiella agarivorans TaxID=3038953 RepID=A0ABU5MUP4_9BACT|nr:hypothetical protein [Pontiella agarivorans]MDZ8117938.1 hypothetical protein [Pontiella agarivorans]
MKHLALFWIPLLLALSSFAGSTADLITNPQAREILSRNCIRLGTSEILPVKFQTAVAVLNNPELVTAVQEEFARSISSNGTVDFPIIGNGEHRYYYINEYDQRTDLTELYKKQTDRTSYDYIVWAGGKRRFGYYDVIIHLQVTDLGDLGILYSVHVHAWPHSWFTRTSHRLGFTRSYFRDNMKFISRIAREIALGLCEQEEINAQLEHVTK